MFMELIDVLAGKWFDWRVRRSAPRTGDELMIREVKVANDGGMKVVAEHPAMMILADEAVALLDAANAENYVQFDMVPRPDKTKLRPIRVTVQWAHGMSPGTKNLFLESALRDIQQAESGETVRVIAKLALSGVNWREVI